MAFFEKVSASISNTTMNVANKAKEIAEISTINGQINTQEDLIQKTYVALGKAYYEENKEYSAGEHAIQCNAITDAMEQVKYLKEQIQKIKGVVICTKCGGEIPNHNIYCPNCGNKVEKKMEQSEVIKEEDEKPSVKICITCGNQVNHNEAFCGTCGQKM